jgi:hypothetical protein
VTTESFDPVTGVLRLAPSSLRSLVSLHGGSEMAPDETERLRGVGVIEGQHLEPRVARLAETVGRAWARLSFDLRGQTTGTHVEGWITPEAAALALGARAHGSSVADFILLPPGIVPLQLARLLRLGPRARPKVVEPVELDAALLEILLCSSKPFTLGHIDALTSGETLIPPWKEVLEELSRGTRGRWRAGCWWNSATQSPQAREMEVVDSDAGSFLVTPKPPGAHTFARVQLRPVTPAAIWRLLCSLMPDVSEVDRPLSP